MNPIRSWFQKRRLDRELAAEMAEHLAEKIDHLRAEGYGEEEARALARRQFGNLTQQREASRTEWGWNTAEQFAQDIRFAVRVLQGSPVFSVTVILLLALGIGMNTAMFSAIKAVLLTALPYPQPERMVELRQVARDGHLMRVSWLDFHDWRSQNQTVQAMAVAGLAQGVTLSGAFRTRRAPLANVGAGFFEVAATDALIGRTFTAADQKPGSALTIILSYELAASLFGSPAAALQKTVHLNGMPFTVIGVMPPKFEFPYAVQLWIPNDVFPDQSGRSAHNYSIFGRLKPGVTVARAQSDLDVVAARLAKQYADDKDEGIRVTSLYDSLTGSIRPALYVLFSAVMLVLLIACVNISNLQLARAAARRKEMGMRTALGAGRGRLIRQLLTESALLAIVGGTVGLLLAEVAVRVLRMSAPANIPRLQTLSVDGVVLAFTAALSLLAGLLFGMLPAIDGAHTDVNEALKQATGKGSDMRHKRWGQLLVAAEVALALILLSGSALLIKSYWKLSHVDIGLSSQGVFLTDVTWPAAADGDSVDSAFVRRVGAQILSQVAGLPGVQATAFIHGMPFQDAPDGNFEIEGRPLPADPHQAPDADYRLITPGYFKVFGVSLLNGRAFTVADSASSEQVAIVNQSFARRFFPQDNVLGKRIRFLGFDRQPQFLTIVGLVPDVRASFGRAVQPEVYVDYFQHADTRMNANLVVRGPARLQPGIEQIVTSLNHVTAANFESMDRVISGTVSRERFETVLLAVFAGTALLLAVVGVYGLLSYLVTRRTAEMGLRIALGASTGRILYQVLGEGGRLIVVGLAIGLPGSLLATRGLQAMLYQVKASDPFTLLAAVAAFAVAALLACYLPAQRAARIDPAEALRSE
jgi:predicted permease